MEVNEKIKKYLEEHGITQASLSRRTGISYRRIHYIVKLNGGVKNDEIFKIAEALGVDANFFNPSLRKIANT